LSVIALRSIPAFVYPVCVRVVTKAGMKRSGMTVTAEFDNKTAQDRSDTVI